MKQVSKIVVVNEQGKYLLMYRSDHPRFGRDADLPGGTLEEGEQPIETMVREVFEEAGFNINKNDVTELYSGTDYSKHGTHYSLFAIKLNFTPEIKMSWEHSDYEWIDRDDFLEKTKNAKDTYMHMVSSVVLKF